MKLRKKDLNITDNESTDVRPLLCAKRVQGKANKSLNSNHCFNSQLPYETIASNNFKKEPSMVVSES